VAGGENFRQRPAWGVNFQMFKNPHNLFRTDEAKGYAAPYRIVPLDQLHASQCVVRLSRSKRYTKFYPKLVWIPVPLSFLSRLIPYSCKPNPNVPLSFNSNYGGLYNVQITYPCAVGVQDYD